MSRPSTRRSTASTPTIVVGASAGAVAAGPGNRELHPELVRLLGEPPGLGLQLRYRIERLVVADLQRVEDALEPLALVLDVQDRPLAGECLDAAHAGGDAAFLHDREEADVARRAAVGAAAQLHAEPGHGHHADGVAVLLAEERHRAGRDGLVPRTHLGHDGSVPVDLRVHDALDLAQLRRRDRPEVHEVEAQPIRRDQRAGLLHVRAEHLPQRRVQEVRGRVVPACRVAHRIGRPRR